MVPNIAAKTGPLIFYRLSKVAIKTDSLTNSNNHTNMGETRKDMMRITEESSTSPIAANTL